MMTKLKMGTKISLGFLFVTLVLVIVAAATLIQVARTSATTKELIERDQPMAEESVRVLNGVNESLATLRGWMLIKDERFKTERSAAWTDTVNPAIARLRAHFVEAGHVQSDDVTGLKRKSLESLTPFEKVLFVELALGELEEAQQELEDIAQTDDNIPAYKILLTESVPQARDITTSATALIDEEASLDATAERKQLLTNLANFRESFTAGTANLRAYLLSGDEAFHKSFDEQWRINQIAYDAIEGNAALLMGEQPKAWGALKTKRAAYEPFPQKIFASRSSKNWNKAISGLSDNAAPLALLIRNTLESLLTDDLRPAVTAKRATVDSSIALLKAIVWTLMLVGVVASGLCGFVTTADFNRLGESIKTLLSELRASSQEISAASQQQVASMTESTASINEISSTAEEFKATIQEFVDRARAVREAAEEMAKRAADGLNLTKATALKNDEVRMSFEAAGGSILKLSQQMQQITQITTSVNEIAEQTKLLALNASIEAARAGEEGRGFAVVATQVRELANQSKEASSRIASQIADIQGSVQTVISNSGQGNQKLTDANEMGQQMAQAFQEIVNAIQHTTDAMRQMDQAARQQESGMSDLVTGIAEVDAGSKETLTTAEQTQKAIAAVDERSRELSKIVAQLKS
jgi:methyl-accepting chemotaxis protein